MMQTWAVIVVVSLTIVLLASFLSSVELAAAQPTTKHKTEYIKKDHSILVACEDIAPAFKPADIGVNRQVTIGCSFNPNQCIDDPDICLTWKFENRDHTRVVRCAHDKFYVMPDNEEVIKQDKPYLIVACR